MRRVLKVLISILALFAFYKIILIQKIFQAEYYNRCESLQKPIDIMLDNLIWQVVETSQGRVNLLNAYLDERFDRKLVRVNSIGPKSLEVSYDRVYCQFWFENEKYNPQIVKVSKFVSLWIARTGVKGKLFIL